MKLSKIQRIIESLKRINLSPDSISFFRSLFLNNENNLSKLEKVKLNLNHT